MAPIGIGIVGVGKIARDQHLPSIAADSDFRLLAVATRQTDVAGVRRHATLDEMVGATPGLAAVALCTPPGARTALARGAIAAGLHVMLEKPPGKTVTEVIDLAARAHAAGVTLFATWHSREAAGVEAAQRWLATRRIHRVAIRWHEDVRHWHPGQLWLWEPGGLGVFDPGINALSIATRILPGRLCVEAATLFFPSNRDAPIAADLSMSVEGAACMSASFDFRHRGVESWEIDIDTDGGRLVLSRGGASAFVGATALANGDSAEYPALYRRFAQLIATRSCDVDLMPLQLTADAFMCGRRVLVEPFDP